MKIKEALSQAKQQLKSSPTASLDSEVLLRHSLSCERSELISRSEEELTKEQFESFQTDLKDRQKGKPIAYIIQEKEFYGRNFFVDERVLIPRPETEEMLEDALEFLKAHPKSKTVIDLGTGSGCIAITLALELPDREIIGLELSKKALEVAEINKKKHDCKNLKFFESDLLSALPTSNFPFPTILANLPYIGTSSNHFVSDETETYEPHVALFGGEDGLELYRRTWQQIKDIKLDIAAMFMEIGFSQVESITKEAQEAFPAYHFEVKNDLAGLPRTAILKKQSL